MVGRGVNGRPASPLRAVSSPGRDHRAVGVGRLLPPDALGACLGCGAETKARTLSCGCGVLPVLSFIPSALSPQPGRQEKAGLARPPSVNPTTLLRAQLSQQPLPPPHPPPFLFQAPRAKQTPVLGLFPKGSKSPIRWTFLPNSPWTRRVPLPFPSLPFAQGLASGGFSPLSAGAGSGLQVSPGP